MIFILTLSSKGEAESLYKIFLHYEISDYRGKKVKNITLKKKKIWIECEDDS